MRLVSGLSEPSPKASATEKVRTAHAGAAARTLAEKAAWSAPTLTAAHAAPSRCARASAGVAHHCPAPLPQASPAR
jgi:hypothetical protein